MQDGEGDEAVRVYVDLGRRLQRAQDLAASSFDASMEADALAGLPVWLLGDEPDLGEWQGRDRENWVRLVSVADPELGVVVRLAPTEHGVALTGLLLERAGFELTSRDLRVRLRPLLERALAEWRGALPEAETPVRPSRPGRKGYDPDHWRQVAALYDRAKQQQPRAPIKALRMQYPTSDRPSYATARRWVDRVEAMRAEGEL